MKFTDEDRKEVAKNLREVNPTSLNSDSCMGYACLWEALKRSFPRIKENAHDVLDELDNLADLIEPEPELTCEPREQWEDGDTLPYLACSNCGEPLIYRETKTFENEYELCPYCAECGAKVVE